MLQWLLTAAISCSAEATMLLGRPVKAQCLGSLEQVSDGFVQLSLVLLHRQDVIGAAAP